MDLAYCNGEHRRLARQLTRDATDVSMMVVAATTELSTDVDASQSLLIRATKYLRRVRKRVKHSMTVLKTEIATFLRGDEPTVEG
jgi:hypothetical protein